MPWIPPTFWKNDNIWSRALTPASLLYGRLQKTLYNAHTPYRSSLPVLCVGNVQLGGSGKTPLAQALVRLARERGLARNPVILLRGYGGELKGPLLVSPQAHNARHVGDEALLHARYAPTIVARNRASGARLAEQSGYDLIVMDDGLQNNQLEKTLSFLVFNSAQGLGNEHLFPAGPLREDIPAALAKTSALLLVGQNLPFETTLPVYRAHINAPAASDPHKPYLAFCGIGQPEKFYSTLAAHHYTVAASESFADHHPYNDATLQSLADKADAQGAALITTEKDWMRLPLLWRERVEFLPITYQFDQPDALAAQIREAVTP